MDHDQTAPYQALLSGSTLFATEAFKIAQLVASQTADLVVESLILAQSHTFMEIDHKIVSTVILLLLLIQEGLLSVASKSMCTKCWLIA